MLWHVSGRCLCSKGKLRVCSVLFRSCGLMLWRCFHARISGRCFRWKGKRGVCSVLYICSARAVLCCGIYLDAASAEKASSESALYCSARAVLCCGIPCCTLHACRACHAWHARCAWNPSYAHDGGSASHSNVSGNVIVRFSSTTLRPTEFSSLTIECLKV